MTLVSCIECGHQVSETAGTCPRCKDSPHGLVCQLCRQRMKRSTAVTQGTNTLCEACGEDLFMHDGYCQACGVLMWPGADWRQNIRPMGGFGLSCPRCGERNPFGTVWTGTCGACSLPLLPRVHGIVNRNGDHFHIRCAPTSWLAVAGAIAAAIITLLFLLSRAC